MFIFFSLLILTLSSFSLLLIFSLFIIIFLFLVFFAIILFNLSSFIPLILFIFFWLFFISLFLLWQLIHLHFEVQDLPLWKQSQYFFEQFEFMHLHVQLFLVEFIFWIAFGFLDIIILYFSCLNSLLSSVFLQFTHEQSLQNLPLAKHSQ